MYIANRINEYGIFEAIKKTILTSVNVTLFEHCFQYVQYSYLRWNLHLSHNIAGSIPVICTIIQKIVFYVFLYKL